MKPHTRALVQSLLRAGFAAMGACKAWFEIETGKTPPEPSKDEPAPK